jgi:hypothetical protein
MDYKLPYPTHLFYFISKQIGIDHKEAEICKNNPNIANERVKSDEIKRNVSLIRCKGF